MRRSRRSSSSTAINSSLSSIQVKKSGKKLPVVTSASISASLRQASSNADEAAVVIRGKISGRLDEHAACNSGVHLKQQGSRLRLMPVEPDMNFWKGICRPALLVQALANIGTLVVADSALLFPSSKPRYSFSALTADRLLTAIQATVDAMHLLQSVDEGGGEVQSLHSAVYAKWEVIRKLIQLAESAVPMKLSLCSDLVTARNGDAVHVPPTTPLALYERLRCLQRLLQLRESYLRIMTTLRQCRTKREVTAAIFGTVMCNTDTVETMPGMTSWHQQEQRVIKELMEQINDIVPCSDSWGDPLGPSLRVAAGSYILHRRSRFETSVSLLNVAEFFGLPPFLRSIRIVKGRPRAFSSQPVTVLSTVDDSTLLKRELKPSLFISPYDLDSGCFDDVASGQAQVLQEELIELASRHCCFGALVGEADQVVALLHASATFLQQTRTKKREEEVMVMKTESADKDEPTRVLSAEGAHNDPLCSYAQSLLKAANDGDKRGSKVHWLCCNRWSSTMSYYALVIATVPPYGSDDVVWNKEEKEEEGGRGVYTAPYYVAAVLELVRF